MFEWSSTTERPLRPIHSELLRFVFANGDNDKLKPPGLHKNFNFHNPKTQYSSEPDDEFPYQRYFKVLFLLVLHNEADACLLAK